MEGLRKQAVSEFGSINFVPFPADHELITLDTDAAGARFNRTSVPLPSILEQIDRSQEPELRSIPIFRLVVLHLRHPPTGPVHAWEPPTLNAAKDDVLSLWRLFDLDATALHLLSHGIKGMDSLPPSSRGADGDVLRFMVNSYTYCVIWSFHARTRTTSGVLIARPNTPAKLAHVENWWQALQSQVAIVRHPLCLFTTLATEALQRTFRWTVKSQSQINHLEWKTGYNPWAPDSQGTAPPMSLEDLSLASRSMGAVMVSLEDNTRQIRLLRRAADHVNCPSIHNLALSDAQSADVATVISLVQQQLASWEIRIDYLRERAKNQLTVIFNLMTRYDASSSIALAKSAKQDSTSMKAIAIMTMAFLPGTFFAALFSMPSLRWDEPPVVRTNFWVYWAFSIPATFAVFAGWVWISRDMPVERLNENGMRGQSREMVPRPWLLAKGLGVAAPVASRTLRQRPPQNDINWTQQYSGGV